MSPSVRSVYPLPVDELADRVREYAAGIGGWPSRRQVMTEFKVGRPKAGAALDALRAAGFDPVPTMEIPVSDPDDPPAAARDDGPGAGVADTSPAPLSSDEDVEVTEVLAPVSGAVDAPEVPEQRQRARWGSLPLVLIALGAFVSIWGGWVGLGELTGFGPIRLLPGIADHVIINSAITLPIGVEAYAAFALRVWLAPPVGLSDVARRFARWSAIGALGLGAAGQIAYHLMVAAGISEAPWPITAFVSCLPVVVLGCGAALAHLIHRSRESTAADVLASRRWFR